MLKQYKIGFEIWGLILFLAIMLPNFIWFIVPAPNDILRTESVTELLDTFASIFQIITIIVLCFILNINRKRISLTPMIATVITCCLLYFITWIFYYTGITNVLVILSLCITPSLALLFFSVDRKNMIAVVSISIFIICHLIYAIMNFIIKK